MDTDQPTVKETRPHGPTRLIVATVSTGGHYPAVGGPEIMLTGQEVYATYSRRRPTGWTQEADPDCFPCDHFWIWVSRLVVKRSRLWMICPRADEFLTLSRFFEHVESGLFSLRIDAKSKASAINPRTGKPIEFRGALVTGQRCTIVEAACGDGRLFVCSTGNYVEATDYRVCCATGQTVDTGLDPNDRTSEPPIHPEIACKAWTKWVRGTISSWLENGRGNWQPTAAGLAVAAWRKTDGPKAARRHNNEEALDLECSALHGGRQSAFYVGDCGDRSACDPNPHPLPPKPQYPTTRCIIDRYDTRSMYPYIMGHEIFPVQLGGFHVRPKLDAVRSWVKYECCIASVTLDTRNAEYPCRYPRGSDYPLGVFQTTLAGPELAQALHDKIVKKVWAASRYLPGRPFTEWSDFVLNLREQCRADGDILGLWLAKTIATSFSGRFAMSQRRWLDRDKINAPILWGHFEQYNDLDKTYDRYRAICGRTKQLVIGRPGYRLLAAVYCYLTSYGRMMMRKIRESQPPKLVVSQCTDSLWVIRADRGPQHTIQKYEGTEPGSLRTERSFNYMRLIDANRYYADGKWVLSGTPAGFWIDDKSMICSVESENPLNRGTGERPEWISQRVSVHPAAQIPIYHTYGQDGWLIPPIAGSRSDYLPSPYSPDWVKPPRNQLVIPGFQKSPHAH